MNQESIIYYLLAVNILALIINVVFKKFGISSVIGYIATGMIAAEAAGVTSNHILDIAAELGVVFLMFMVGLEFSLEKFKSMKREVLYLGLSQIIITSSILFAFFTFFNIFDFKVAFLVAITLSLSSTAIAIKILKDSGKIRRNHGRCSVGILLMQDIAVIPILIMATIFTNQNQSLPEILSYTAINSICGFLAIYIFGKYIVKKLLHFIVNTRSNELFMMTVLTIVIAAASIAHFFSIPYAMGAFVAGIIISESTYKHQIEADLLHFKDLLIGIFFMSVGLLLNIELIIKYAYIIVPSAIGIIVLKTAITYFISVFIGYQPRTAIKTALLTSQVGEFAFVIFTFVVAGNMLDKEIAQILAAITITTMFITPFLAKYLDEISYKLTHDKDDEIIERTKSLQRHAVVIGYGNTGKWVVAELERIGIDYKAIDNQKDLVYDAQNAKKNVIFGNATKKNILEVLNIKDSSFVIITVDRHEDLLHICDTIKTIYPESILIAKARNGNNYTEIKNSGVRYAIDQSKEMGAMLVNIALQNKN